MSQPAPLQYRQLRLRDLRVGTVAPCGLWIYMPVNRKHVHYIAEGTALESEHFEKLRAKRITALFAAAADLPKFYAYATAQAKLRDPSARASATERRHHFEDELRAVIEPALAADFAQPDSQAGQLALERLTKALTRGVLERPTSDLRSQVWECTGEMVDAYGHLINTAALASYFSLALETGSAHDLGVAALLHDLGELDASKPADRAHVERSCQLIERLQLPISSVAMRAVRQHQERFDGKGFPEGIAGAGLAAETQVLILADLFDEHTRPVPGEPVRTSDELMRDLRVCFATGPGAGAVDPKLANRLLDWLAGAGESAKA